MGKLDTPYRSSGRLVSLFGERVSPEPRCGAVRPVEKIVVRDLDFYDGPSRALSGINLTVCDKGVAALIGRSECGKSTLLRVLNRVYQLYADQRCTGELLIDRCDMLDLKLLCAQVGMAFMAFQKPTPFPISIYENTAFGGRMCEELSPDALDERVERTVCGVALSEEEKDILHHSGLSLSGRQQQDLCIGCAIALEPEILLLDESASVLDPISTNHIEELIDELKHCYSLVIVIHDMQQAARISDDTSFMHLGEIIEFDRTEVIFAHPRKAQAEAYVTGRFG